jgi:hypothetical protein
VVPRANNAAYTPKTLQLVISQRFKRARRPDLSALDPLARQNAQLSDRGDRDNSSHRPALRVRCAAQQYQMPDVRFGSKADIAGYERTPSDHGTRRTTAHLLYEGVDVFP